MVPSSITFSNVVVGQKSTQTVQISNTGNATLNVTSISLTGSDQMIERALPAFAQAAA